MQLMEQNIPPRSSSGIDVAFRFSLSWTLLVRVKELSVAQLEHWDIDNEREPTNIILLVLDGLNLAQCTGKFRLKLMSTEFLEAQGQLVMTHSRELNTH
jgi:hypothetical protein